MKKYFEYFKKVKTEKQWHNAIVKTINGMREEIFLLKKKRYICTNKDFLMIIEKVNKKWNLLVEKLKMEKIGKLKIDAIKNREIKTFKKMKKFLKWNIIERVFYKNIGDYGYIPCEMAIISFKKKLKEISKKDIKKLKNLSLVERYINIIKKKYKECKKEIEMKLKNKKNIMINYKTKIGEYQIKLKIKQEKKNVFYLDIISIINVKSKNQIFIETISKFYLYGLYEFIWDNFLETNEKKI